MISIRLCIKLFIVKIINRSRINVCKQLLMSDLFSNFDHEEFYIQAYGYCIQCSFIVALQ